MKTMFYLAYLFFSFFSDVAGSSNPSSLSFKIHSRTYSDCFAEKDRDIVTVHAGRHMEPSLQLFQQRFPDEFFDVGMAVQDVVTFSAGLSCGGLKPFCVIPSAFLQRAYDQMFKSSRVLRVHCSVGAFDITFMACLPNMIVMAPSNEDELAQMVATAAYIDDGLICF
ncbi:hypothetical protein FNV43_RR12352 [Rhamnella rubrinervis]|uniref:Transketolase-like pyrimidine-binding domain-containing protein n=1 Tax=Rhamnella rubrinervis TaxID=2594499 RepID=A0A8K0MIK0_9ROSA|nr:hypothetical protein FNV43_RR12352 [Rhamnella rubrinervis]